MHTRTILPLLTFLLVVAFAVRLHQIQAQSLWFDEGWSAYAAARPTLAAAFDADLTNPPLYYVLINLHARLLGDSVFALRLFSTFAGLLTIPLSYQLGRRVGGMRAGVFAAVLVTLSAPLWWAAQEARMYTLLALLILIAALAWQHLITKPSRGAWIALGAAELLLLYAHNTGVVAALWLNIVTLLLWLWRRGAFRPHWRDWLILQAVVGALWLPYFLDRFVRLADANSAVSSAPVLSPALLFDVWQSLLTAPYALVNRVPSLLVLSLISALGAALVVRRRAGGLWLHSLIQIAGLIAALMILGNDLHGRYLVMIVPLVLSALGVGLALSTRAQQVGALIAFALLFGINWTYARNPLYGHDDARGMVQYYADHLTSNDTVLAWSYADRYELAYYWDRLGVEAGRVTLPEGADLDAVLPLLPTDGDVALNVWYTQRADYRGMMDCILQQGTLTPPSVHTTYGMSTLLYANPAPFAPRFVPFRADFRDSAGVARVRLDAVGMIADTDAAAGMCVPVSITLLTPTDAELKAALIVRNALGWEIARADAPFAQADQRTSERVAVGEPLTAYPLLRLPLGTPRGSYRLYLRIYDEREHISGLTPPADLPSSGRDLAIGRWTAVSATWRDCDGIGLINVDARPADGERIANGGAIQVETRWCGAPESLVLRDEAGRWQVETRPAVLANDTLTLDWRLLRVPSDAVSGTATLRMFDGTVLATYTVEALPLLSSAPSFDHPLNVEFPGVGTLVGYTANAPPYTRDHPPRLSLIWRADGAAPVDYTVFAQLISDDGMVVAQSDHAPGGRATTGWRAGEYVLDEHTLAFNIEPRAGRLVVGLYDAATNTRVRLADGSDAVALED